MSQAPASRGNRSFVVFSKTCAAGVVAVACLVLVGWGLDVVWLKSLFPGFATMKVNTAVLLVLCGAALWLNVARRAPWISRALGAAVLAGGALTLAEYVFGRDLGIDQLLFPDLSVGLVHPGRPSPAAAVQFLLVGFAFLVPRQLKFFLHDLLVISTLAISGLVLIGYVYDVSSLYQIGAFNSMALHTALCFLVLSLGLLASRPEEGVVKRIFAPGPGGEVLRRFLPVAVFVPIVLGVLDLLAQRAGLYDGTFGLAILVTSLIAALTIFIGLNARRVSESETRRLDTLEDMNEGYQIIGFDWKYRYLNQSAIAQSQRTRETLVGFTMMECYPGIEQTPLFAALQRCMTQRQNERLVNEFKYHDGSRGWFELSIQPSKEGILILSSDITRQRNSEQEAHEHERKLATLFSLLPVGIAILDEDRKVSYFNSSMKDMLSLSEEGLKRGDFSRRRYLRADGTTMPNEELASVRALSEGVEIDRIETGIVKEDGSTVWTMVSAVPVDFPDWKAVVVTTDITAQKAAETEIRKLNAELEERVTARTAELAEANQQLQILSLFDVLTGLYNRRGFEILAEEKLRWARRGGQTLLCIFADLDNLKTLNDEQGHSAGDAAIVAVARGLEETFRSSDVIARLGGDEFVVLAVQDGEHSAQVPLERLNRLLAQDRYSVSVGIVAVGPDETLSLAGLIARADEAMYAQKRNKPHRRA